MNVDVLTHHASIELSVANFGFSVAVALYLFGLWYCHERILATDTLQSSIMLIVAGGVIALGLLPHSVISIGVLILATVMYRQYRPLRNEPELM